MSKSFDPRIAIGIVIALVVASALSNRRSPLWRGPAPEPKIMSFDDDDEPMNEAMKQARDSVQQFIQALTKPNPSQSHFSVKVGFQDPQGDEYIWLNDVRYRDGAFTGTVGNVPETVKSTYFGAPVSVSESQIADWMYIENGRLNGGFTMRVMRSRLSDAERAQFDANIRFTIE